MKNLQTDFKLLLVDLNKQVTSEFQKQFKPQEDKNIEIFNCPFEKIQKFDCVVSPANSFGLMDGGFDMALTIYFGDQLQKRVQKYIIENYDGEQTVGTSFIIPTNNKTHPFLAHTPTMRTPININGTDNVYTSMKSMLQAVHKWNLTEKQKITSVLCPGLGTNYGKVPADEGVRQMKAAWDNYCNPLKELNWDIANKRQQQVKFGGLDQFEKEINEKIKQK